MYSKTSQPVCQNGGELVAESLWVVRPATVEGLPQMVIVCIGCDQRLPLNDLNWYTRSHDGRERSCNRT